MGDKATAPHIGVVVNLCADDVTLPKYSDVELPRKDWFSVYRIGK
jgi:hypothetical protein